MKKSIMVTALFAITSSASLASAEVICGEISESEGRLYITMGNTQAQLAAEDGWIFKPKTELERAVGSEACLAGDWISDYVFSVIRVDR